MSIRKTLLVVGAASSIALASIAGVSAATNSSANDGRDNLINKIARKFNLKPAEVKAVFEEEHAAREAEHKKSFEAKLDQLVKDGKITPDQKAKILAKKAEMKAEMKSNRTEMKDMTPAERKAEMQKRKAELEQWANDNGINTDYLKLVIGHGPGGHGRHGGFGGPGHGPDADDQATGAAQN